MKIEKLPKDVFEKVEIVGNCFNDRDMYKNMLKAIDNIVSTDFLMDMEWKELPNSKPYTQEEALQMSQTIGQVYMIAHAVHCSACIGKWKIALQRDDSK